nr:twin-arginine translocation signal domain-containing protein [Halorussus aquaticus]
MAHDDSTSRRKFLTAAGAAAATASFAGCTGGESGQETTTETDTTTEETTEAGTETTQSGDAGEFPVTITQGQMPSTLDPQNHRETPTDKWFCTSTRDSSAGTRRGKSSRSWRPSTSDRNRAASGSPSERASPSTTATS